MVLLLLLFIQKKTISTFCFNFPGASGKRRWVRWQKLPFPGTIYASHLKDTEEWLGVSYSAHWPWLTSPLGPTPLWCLFLVFEDTSGGILLEYLVWCRKANRWQVLVTFLENSISHWWQPTYVLRAMCADSSQMKISLPVQHDFLRLDNRYLSDLKQKQHCYFCSSWKGTKDPNAIYTQGF